MRRVRSWSTIAAVAVAAGLVQVATATTAHADPPVYVVTGGDVSADGSSGWAVESANGGTGAFVQGPGAPPLGTGSYHLASHAIGDKQFLHLTKVDGTPLLGTPLTDFSQLTYASYASDGTYSPYLNIPIHSSAIDANKDGIADGDQPGVPGATGNATLVYEPSVPGGAWGTNDTINGTATWRLTRPVVVGGVTTPLWTYKTWGDWTALLGDAVVNPTYGDIQFVIGDTSTPAWAGREGWVDDITVVTTSAAATYDLEEGLGSCPVTINNATQTLTLKADCTTNQTLTLHDGWTLDGAGHTITAVDPSSGSFTGPILTNDHATADQTMNVTDVHLVGDFAAGCSSSLFGIQFNDAAGSFTHSTVANVRYGSGSGCQSGNSVDITNLGGANRMQVDVDDVQVTGFQKTGIRANGNVSLKLTNSYVASSDLDLITASNSLQISRGARAYVTANTIEGNDWDGNTDWNATGVLLYGAENVTFVRNVVDGTDTDFGLYVADAPGYNPGRTTLTCNLFTRDAAADSTPTPGTALDVWDTGVAADEDLTATIDASANTVTGFRTAWSNIDDTDGGPCASGPVQGLTLGGGGSTLTADWNPPAALAYAPVTSYDVTLIPGGDTQTVTGTSAHFSVAPGSVYTVTVVPHSAAGDGTPRSASLDTSAPGRPTGLTATGSTTSAALTWTAPSSPAPLTSYTVTATPPSGPVVTRTLGAGGLTFPVTVTGLVPHTTYAFSVSAASVWGSGPDATTTLRGTTVVTTTAARSVAYGSPATLKGTVTDATTGLPLSGATVILRVRPRGASTYTTVPGLTATTKVDGTFTLTYRPKTRTSVYAVAEGSTALMAAASHSLPLVAHATSSLRLNHTHVTAGLAVRFSGISRPGKGSVVRLQHWAHGRWVTVHTVHVTSTKGRWSLSWTATVGRGYFRVRVSAHGLPTGTSTKRLLVVS